MNFQISLLCIALALFLGNASSSPNENVGGNDDTIAKIKELLRSKKGKVLLLQMMADAVDKTKDDTTASGKTTGSGNLSIKQKSPQQKTSQPSSTVNKIETRPTINPTRSQITARTDSPTASSTTTPTLPAVSPSSEKTSTNPGATTATATTTDERTTANAKTNEARLPTITAKSLTSEKTENQRSTATMTNVPTTGKMPPGITTTATAKQRLGSSTLKLEASCSSEAACTTSQNQSTIAEKPTAKSESPSSASGAKQAESGDDGFSKHGSNFPTFFILILAMVVMVYIGYHNRNKIRTFIKTGYSSKKENSSGYFKVKVEDDIDLPRDANRHYVY